MYKFCYIWMLQRMSNASGSNNKLTHTPEHNVSRADECVQNISKHTFNNNEELDKQSWRSKIPRVRHTTHKHTHTHRIKFDIDILAVCKPSIHFDSIRFEKSNDMKTNNMGGLFCCPNKRRGLRFSSFIRLKFDLKGKSEKKTKFEIQRVFDLYLYFGSYGVGKKTPFT